MEQFLTLLMLLILGLFYNQVHKCVCNILSDFSISLFILAREIVSTDEPHVDN